MIQWLILICLFGYLCGSLPTGYLIVKKKGLEIQKIGSGAIGATNVSRVLGPKFGALTSIADVFKSWLPVFLATLLFTENWTVFLVAILVILGHIFPVWLRFKGGKGVACLIGILLALDFKLALFWGLTWLIIFAILLIATRVSKASFSEKMATNNLLTIWYLPVLFWFVLGGMEEVIFAFVLVGIIYFAHRENIVRIKNIWKKTKKAGLRLYRFKNR